MRKILYISGTRADYGLMKSVLLGIHNDPNLELEIVATGMHLMPEFGNTLEEIKKDQFKIHIIDSIYKKDNKESMSTFIGDFIQKLTEKVTKINPTIILLLGDRAEMLGAAIVGAYLSIPIVHLHGGDVTSTIDNSARNAITKLAHFHLPATELSADRIKKMGEEEWRIKRVNSPALDCIQNRIVIPKEELFRKLGLKNEKTILSIQHPVTIEVEDSDKQIKETLEAIKELDHQSIIIYPNADTGGRKMIPIIESYQKEPKFRIFKNLDHNDYINLLSYVDVMVGNSSSGILEASSFNLPVVNIGTRQKGRERSTNIIDVDYNKEEIKKAIKTIILNENNNKNNINPYNNTQINTNRDIIEILNNLKISNELIQK